MSKSYVQPPWAEIAFIGRSNVGKSSLLNGLLGSKDHKFVPVSRQPGKTATIDFYGVGTGANPELVLVDTPGYGFSRGGFNSHSSMMEDVAEYLTTRDRDVLKRVAVLVDAKLGLGELDIEMLRRLEQEAIPVHVIATKADTASPGQLEALALRTATILSNFIMPYPVLNAVSAKTGLGMKELKLALVQTARLRRPSGRVGGTAPGQPMPTPNRKWTTA